jgi:hypothetical protein
MMTDMYVFQKLLSEGLNWWGNNAMMENINKFSGHNFLSDYVVIYLMLDI